MSTSFGLAIKKLPRAESAYLWRRNKKRAAQGQPEIMAQAQAVGLVVLGGLVSAILADAVKVMHMAAQLEAVFFGHFALEFFNAWIADFYDLAAVKADKVVMVTVRLGDLIAGDAIAEMDFHGKARIAQQFERAIHGGLADAGIALDYVLIKFFKRVVAGQFKKSLGYDAPLGCGVQAFTAHEIQKFRQTGVILLCCHISAHPRITSVRLLKLPMRPRLAVVSM